MIQVTDKISLPESELQFNFIRASGPGGQHVNKTATAVQLRFSVLKSACLSDAVKSRLLRLAGRRATIAGEIVLESGSTRSQADNREEVVARLLSLIRRAAKPPRPRFKTKPTAAARERRLHSKKQTAERKHRRQSPRPDSDT